MNIIKTAFLVALFNYIIVGAIVLAFKKTDVVSTPTVIQVRPTSPVNQVVVTQVPVLPVVVDNRCIIVVDGSRYDISQFRNQHSGGDIFQCGTDMSTVFHDRHPNSFLDRMSKYRI